MRPNLVVIGHVMREMIRFPDHTAGPFLGGAAAYFSIVAAKLGGRIGIVTKVGNDIEESLLLPLSKAGVDIRGIKRSNESRHSLLIYDKEGNKRMEYPKEGEAISFEDIPQDYLKADIIYIAPQEKEIPFEIVERLSQLNIRLAVELGGYGGAHWSKHPKKDQTKFLKDFLPYFHIAKASREDFTYLLPLRNYEDEDLVKILVKWGADIGLLTLGKDGAMVSTGDDLFKVPSFTEKAVDCTGAGDAFAAGFLFSYQRDNDLKKASIFASATASLVIEETGGISLERMPCLSEVERRIKKEEG